MTKKIAIIAGAGPAGLTAALELLRTTDVKPIIFESENFVGGISRTVNYKGNRMDIGGHRFFSKSTKVMDWWQNILPLQGHLSKDDIEINRNIPLQENGPDPETTDGVMLRRSRLSRILYRRRLFDYPVSLNMATVKNLGLMRMLKIGLSYMRIKVTPKRKEKSLEDFMINRFGVELYKTFFRDYTEKVWGVSCKDISPEWGGQRIKGLSISKTILHALKAIFKKKDSSIGQKNTETSLISAFLYPKLGPGELWETVAKQIIELGGEIHLNTPVVKVNRNKNRVVSVSIDKQNYTECVPCDYFLSTMPVKDLVKAMDSAPIAVSDLANGLVYRDFMTVGLLLDSLDLKSTAKKGTPESRLKFVADNWIYVQESDVKLGRIQIFNNWSPYLVKDKNFAWIGLEYFVNEGDSMWNMKDEDFIKFSIEELEKIQVAKKENVKDATLIRVKKAYPAYFGSYGNFNQIKEYLDKTENLFLMGRNGMHKYNNMDHSMLTAIEVVRCISQNSFDKTSVWNVNTEDDYHEGSAK